MPLTLSHDSKYNKLLAFPSSWYFGNFIKLLTVVIIKYLYKIYFPRYYIPYS